MTDSPHPNPSHPSTTTRSAPNGALPDSAALSAPSDAFMTAWKRGVILAGPYLFARSSPDAGPNSRRDLRPNVSLIHRAIGPKSPAERFFLAALVSCYDPEEGGLLLKRSGFHGCADFGRLDLARRTVLAALVLHIKGACDFRIPDPLPTLDSLSDDSGGRSPWDAIAREERHFAVAPEVFLTVWKRGVALAGVHLFGESPHADLELATTKWDLCPKVRLISCALRSLSPLEQLFISGLVSFYNAEDGGRLLKRAGFRGLIDLAPLSVPHRAVIAGLILNYTGW